MSGGTIWQRPDGTWCCIYHGVITFDANGKPSCGCGMVEQFGWLYAIRKVDTVNLPSASKPDAK